MTIPSRRRREVAFGICLAVLLVLVVAKTWQPIRRQSSDDSRHASPIVNRSTLVELGKPAPAFRLQLGDQSAITEETFGDQSVGLLVFADPGCLGCEEQIADLSVVGQQLGSSVRIVVVRSDSSEPDQSSNGLQYAVDQGSAARRAFGVTNEPTLVYLFGQRVVGLALGRQPAGTIEREARKFLTADPSI